MGTEIEKKYRLTIEQREALSQRLREVGAVLEGKEFEENMVYAGDGLDPRRQLLRLRRVGGEAVLTYKESDESASAVKRRREDETRVADADALGAILEAIGFRPALVYEKRRATWQLNQTEIVIDELPFGSFAEIEGEEKDITEVESLLNLVSVEAELASYPELTEKHGERRGEIFEARFQLTLPEAF